MKDPSNTGRAVLRVGSPLWTYRTGIIALGGLVFLYSVFMLTQVGQLIEHPVFWAVAAMVVLGDLWPIMSPGRDIREAPRASVTFSLAALIVWGLPFAVLMRTAALLLGELGRRRSVPRAAFNAASSNLALAAAGAILLAFGERHLQTHAGTVQLHWLVPNGSDVWPMLMAGVVLCAVNFVVVGIGIALYAREPIRRVLRRYLPFQALVSVVLVASAPLVAVVIGNGSPVLVALFGVPLVAMCANAVRSVQRDHQAQHDELTGLANRKHLMRRLASTLASAASSETKAGLLLLDLDRHLKEVNDTLGHAVGDRLLRLVADRLKYSIRPGDLVARLGGDEFAVLLPSIREASVAREVAARVRAAVSEPIRLEGMSFVVEVSIGIAMFPDDATADELLLQRADAAMYLAKQRRSGTERYVADLDRNSPARLALSSELRRSLDRGEFQLHYQPILSMANRQLVGMEALLRWSHPARGVLAPGDFIPVVEQSYLMREVTAFVIDTALADAVRWREAGLGVPVSLNVSGRDLLGNALVELVREGLARHRLAAEALLLEIDERVLTSQPTAVATTAAALAGLGVGLSLDNFGTGFSSLVRLRQLPIKEIKIDSSFVGRLLESPDDEVVVKSIVDLAAALGIRSVAEGVESAEVAAALIALGCDAAQGWYFDRPMNAAAATAWLAENRGSARQPSGRRTGAVPKAASPRVIAALPPAGLR
jgi:diguanylate cyclase (GGDEF)-like protein